MKELSQLAAVLMSFRSERSECGLKTPTQSQRGKKSVKTQKKGS